MALKTLLLAAVLMTAGCGTLGNISGRDRIYGGAELDGTAFVDACKDVAHSDNAPHFTVPQVCEVFVFSGLDLPLSLAADTVTLPITVPVTVYRWLKPPVAKQKPMPVETVAHSDGPESAAVAPVPPPEPEPGAEPDPAKEEPAPAAPRVPEPGSLKD